MERDDVFRQTNRKQWRVSPHGVRLTREDIATPALFQVRNVIPHQQRPPCRTETVNLSGLKSLTGAAAFKMSYRRVCHLLILRDQRRTRAIQS